MFEFPNVTQLTQQALNLQYQSQIYKPLAVRMGQISAQICHFWGRSMLCLVKLPGVFIYSGVDNNIGSMYSIFTYMCHQDQPDV